MLRIRAEHMSALEVQQASGFTSRMMLHLREAFTEEVADLDDPALGGLVEKVCAQGETWDITEEQDLERLIELFVCFELIRRDPLPVWISRIVKDSNRSAEQVIGALEDQLRFGEHV